MVEAAGAFCISHTLAVRSAADLQAFLAESHIRPAWIDSIHAIGAVDTSDYPANGIKPDCTIYPWPEGLFAEQRILHSAIHSILLGEVEMTLLVRSSAAVILASHIAVGRHNLVPLAAFGAISAFNPGESPLLEQLNSSIQKLTPGEPAPNALLISGSGLKRPVKKGTPFENAAWVASAGSSALAGCCSVIDALATSHKKRGLAVEVEPGGLVFYTALERV